MVNKPFQKVIYMTAGARETLLLYILLILGNLRIAMLTEKLEQLYGFIRSISEEHFMEIEYKKPLITVYS